MHNIGAFCCCAESPKQNKLEEQRLVWARSRSALGIDPDLEHLPVSALNKHSRQGQASCQHGVLEYEVTNLVMLS